MSFGKAARRRREELGLSRKAVLDALKAKDITMALISLRRIEADERQPRVDEALALAEIYQTTVEQLATPNPFDVLAQISEQQEKLNKLIDGYLDLTVEINELARYVEQCKNQPSLLDDDFLQQYSEAVEKFQQFKTTAQKLATQAKSDAGRVIQLDLDHLNDTAKAAFEYLNNHN